jgi:hypothetical protein
MSAAGHGFRAFTGAEISTVADVFLTVARLWRY